MIAASLADPACPRDRRRQTVIPKPSAPRVILSKLSAKLRAWIDGTMSRRRLQRAFRGITPQHRGLLVSVHIPKTAGTSFGGILDALYGDAFSHRVGSRLWAEETRQDPALLAPGTRCVHGHFPADLFDAVADDRKLVTWIRHPVDRIVSNYFHFLRLPDHTNYRCRRIYEKNLSVTQFAEIEGMRDEASCFTAGKRVDDFDFVGITEHFEASLRLFFEMFGIEPRGQIPQANKNRSRRYRAHRISEAERDCILSLNQRDAAWYEEALARFEADASVKSPVP